MKVTVGDLIAMLQDYELDMKVKVNILNCIELGYDEQLEIDEVEAIGNTVYLFNTENVHEF